MRKVALFAIFVSITYISLIFFKSPTQTVIENHPEEGSIENITPTENNCYLCRDKYRNTESELE